MLFVKGFFKSVNNYRVPITYETVLFQKGANTGIMNLATSITQSYVRSTVDGVNYI